MKPDYYNSMKITPIDYITENNMDFCTGNIIKYASRWDKKGTPVEDLRKIIEYANMLIQGQLVEEKDKEDLDEIINNPGGTI
jgi:hypothetical protein